jgi:quinolinate synthase
MEIPIQTLQHQAPLPIALDIDVEDEIRRLKKDMNAVILAHYYQDDDIQDIADFIGDSLDLSRKAAATDADVIVFCGVKFMAETAKILSPHKTVLLPDLKAGCSLELACPPDRFAAFRANHPDHLALTYINCSAEVKALSDIIVTSTNARAIIDQIPADQKIIFAPDKFLGSYLTKQTGREMLYWDGSCMVHERFSEQELVKLKTRHDNAHVIAHPECPGHLLAHASFIGSTSALLKFTETHPGETFLVMTEPGIIHQMKLRSPGSMFIPVPGMEADGACVSCNNCQYMKLNTIDKLYLCMRDRNPEIHLDADLIARARAPLDRMLKMSESIPQSAVTR